MQSTGSILIVDNEPTIVELLVEILTDEGYVVYSAPDTPRALDPIARHQPALVLLDVGRPGIRGAELIEEIHEAVLVAMPIVLMTTEPCDAAPPLAPSVVECLAKPFDLDKLLACVARYVRPAQPLARYAM